MLDVDVGSVALDGVLQYHRHDLDDRRVFDDLRVGRAGLHVLDLLGEVHGFAQALLIHDVHHLFLAESIEGFADLAGEAPVGAHDGFVIALGDEEDLERNADLGRNELQGVHGLDIFRIGDAHFEHAVGHGERDEVVIRSGIFRHVFEHVGGHALAVELLRRHEEILPFRLEDVVFLDAELYERVIDIAAVLVVGKALDLAYLAFFQ